MKVVDRRYHVSKEPPRNCTNTSSINLWQQVSVSRTPPYTDGAYYFTETNATNDLTEVQHCKIGYAHAKQFA